MAKSNTTSLRLKDDTKMQLEALMSLFKESQTEIMERAIKLLYDDRIRLAEEDMKRRFDEAKQD